MKLRISMATVLLLTVLGTSSVPCRAQKREVSPDEYRVYKAVLGLMDPMPKPDLRVTIFNETLNSKCGEAGYPAPLANGCTFLWVKPDDAKSVQKLLRDQWGETESETWESFVEKNAKSFPLQE